MSTKIYSAYKIVEPSKFWETTSIIIDSATKEVQKVILDIYDKFNLEIEGIKNIYEKMDYPKDELERERYAKSRYLYSMYKEQLTNPYKDFFDLDVSFTIHEHCGDLYLIPYCSCMMRDVFKFLDETKYVTDYSYWDNSDLPDGMSALEWDKRGAVWEIICKPKNWKNQAIFEICTIKMFHQIDPVFHK